jgi:hypothetical protein
MHLIRQSSGAADPFISGELGLLEDCVMVRISMQPRLEVVRGRPANDNAVERWSTKARLWVFISACLGLWLLVDLISDVFAR